MISLQIYRNKSFAVISLQKIGGRGVEYLTQNFKFGREMKSHIEPERNLRRMSSYEFVELKAPLE